MTRAAWAERKVGKHVFSDPRTGPVVIFPRVLKLVKSEHKRAVNVVKREIERVKKDQHTYNKLDKEVRLDELNIVLAALQKGRT